MKKLKYIIFDLGNVLYDVDTTKSVAAFKRLGINNFENQYSLQSQSKLFDRLEKGIITEMEFCQAIKEKFTLPVSHNDIISAWNALLVGFIPNVVECIELAKRNYKICLLSNTNAIHIEHINLEAKKIFGVNSFYQVFDGYFLSFQMEQRKPDSIIYQSVMNELNCSPSDIYFIDDNEDNINSAFEIGWFCHLKKPEENLIDIISSI